MSSRSKKETRNVENTGFLTRIFFQANFVETSPSTWDKKKDSMAAVQISCDWWGRRKGKKACAQEEVPMGDWVSGTSDGTTDRWQREKKQPIFRLIDIRCFMCVDLRWIFETVVLGVDLIVVGFSFEPPACTLQGEAIRGKAKL